MSLEDDLTGRARGRIGTLLRDKWRLDKLLGVGGMAAVYAATHRNGGRAAVKMLHPELSGNAEIRRRFLREGYVANAVEHRGAVRVLDDDTTEDGATYLVMELLVGRSLESRFERSGGRLSEDEVCFVAAKLLDVLEAAHQKGIVHRDVKPANVFLTPDGEVKVLDFGIARLRLESDTSSMATTAGTTMGTPAFMSPEQALGRSELVDARTDVFAVGATMFFLLAGRTIHAAQSLNEQLVYAATRPVEPLQSVAPQVSPSVAAVVDRALAFDKEARFTTAAEMALALRAALAEGDAFVHTARSLWVADEPTSIAPPPPSIDVPRGPSPRAGEKKPWALFAIGGAFGIAALGAVGVLALGGKSAPAASAPSPTQPSQSAPVAVPAPEAVSAPPVVAPVASPAASPSPSAAPPPSAAAAKPAGVKAAPKPPKAGGDWLDRQH